MYKVGDEVVVHTNRHPTMDYNFSNFKVGTPFIGPVIETAEYDNQTIYRVRDMIGYVQWVYLNQILPATPYTDEDLERMIG